MDWEGEWAPLGGGRGSPRPHLCHADGIPWYVVTLPPLEHTCRVQTHACWIEENGRDRICAVRCPCGAWGQALTWTPQERLREPPDKWHNKNSRS